MAGHSKWANTKHRKGAQDAKRGKLFTRLAKEVTVAAKVGGGDAESNPRLRSAIAACKQANMPNDNISRAVQRGTGEIPGVTYEEIQYEGYGPHGTAIIVECMTDNKTRTVAEVRFIFGKHGGNLGENGCVAWMFERKGFILVPAAGIDEDTLMEIVLEAGGDDLTNEGEYFEIYTAPEDFETVRATLEAKGIPMEQAEITMRPTTQAEIDEVKKAAQVLKFLDAMEDNDDVQKLHSNVSISQEIMDQLDE